MESVAKVIIGTWRLVHSISINSKGEKESLWRRCEWVYLLQ
jgi:hypothetical protein